MSTDQSTPPVPHQAAPPPPRARAAAPRAKPVQPAGNQGQAAEDSAEEPQPVVPRRSFLNHPFFQSSGAFLVSMFGHALLLIVLAVIVFDNTTPETATDIAATFFDEEEIDERELVEMNLEDSLEAATEVSAAVYSSAPAVGVEGGVTGMVSAPALDRAVDKNAVDYTTEITIGAPTLGLEPSERLIKEVPDGVLGDPRRIVDDYQQAMDQITQEIMWMLNKGPVLVVWCFDQSESMKDDQKEIRARVDRVYVELGLTDKSQGGNLLTAVTSYGKGFILHTRKGPTADLGEIRDAIDEVPSDPSGEEKMVEAVGKAIAAHRDYAKKRQVALILVTDESGDQETNGSDPNQPQLGKLELAIEEAQNANAKIYVLGREAVFGYPYARMRWPHPQTGEVHWLRIDRGPETGFPEQLQTNGFYARWDAFGSGFGSYEQCRMAKETNGIFFMLPSVETNLVRGEKRHYELEQMKSYKPDLRARGEIYQDRSDKQIRALIWQVIQDLNPYNAAVRNQVVMRHAFSLNPIEFRQQALLEQRKALAYLDYLYRVQTTMEENVWLREQETHPRWQANWDLIYAQVVAFQPRVYEYGRYLTHFMQHPKEIPPPPKPNAKAAHWDLRWRKKTFAEDTSPEFADYYDEETRAKVLEYIAKANKLFDEVAATHPGTPWAERAMEEKKQGYGVDLGIDYDYIYRGTEPLIPIPKL